MELFEDGIYYWNTKQGYVDFDEDWECAFHSALANGSRAYRLKDI